MRLHSLDVQAFGPYATAQHVDFDRLARSGLFLLEGPTGAGKTTILDAITFALYGGLAGEGSGTDRLHSHFAAPGVEPSVTLEFSLRGIRYRISRVPEHQRPKKRGQGYTTEPAQVHLQRLAGGDWLSLSSNKAEAGDQVTEVVGLNRAQFTQVMLLPQGEFARFLRCDDDARRVVLTRLFGTQLYDRITAELDCRRAEAVRARTAAETAIMTAASAAAEAAGLDAEARDEVLRLTRAEREIRLKEIAGELASRAAVTGAGLELAAAAAAAALRAGDQARLRASLMTRLTQALARLREHEGTRAAHDERARLLALARQADPVRPLLLALADAEAAVGAASDELRGLAAEPGDNMLAGRGAAEAAVAAASRADAAERVAASLQHLADDEASLSGREAAAEELLQSADGASARAGALEESRQRLPGLLEGLERELAAANGAAAALDGATARRQVVAAQLTAAVRLSELGPLLAEAGAALRDAVDVHQALVDAHQRKTEARLTGMAAELAAGLADGAACPVCGSADHPAPAWAGDDAVSAEDVGEAEARRDAALAAREQADARRGELAVEEAGLLAAAGGCAAAELAAEGEALAAVIAAAEAAGQDAARLAEQLAVSRAFSERLAEELLAATTEATIAREQLLAAQSDLDGLRARLAAAAADYPSVAARQRGLRESAGRDRALAAALVQLAGLIGAAGEARARAEREALARGFAALDEARPAVLSGAALAELGEQVASWDAALIRLRAEAEADDLAGLDPGQAQDAHAAALAAAAGLARAEEAEQEVRAAHGAAVAQARRFSQRLGEVRAAEEACDRLAEATEIVIRLAGLAKGMEGHRRVALTTYVLRHWFTRVVAAANVQLSAMSSGRYELRRIDEGEHKRQRTGLTLSVIDRHTGEERSPASLSGGETFYTSLALALGLADVVRAEAGGVDLDTLFIDEGFGTLDADTLDQVLGVIDELRDRGRVVGIVSHVADLKDRVAERLEVRRIADGSSAVRVVA
ncbi:MAG: AAA family ATPase [Streptosporangiaceae bacterium]|jgi:exonuclease SbcC